MRESVSRASASLATIVACALIVAQPANAQRSQKAERRRPVSATPAAASRITTLAETNVVGTRLVPCDPIALYKSLQPIADRLRKTEFETEVQHQQRVRDAVPVPLAVGASTQSL